MLHLKNAALERCFSGVGLIQRQLLTWERSIKLRLIAFALKFGRTLITPTSFTMRLLNLGSLPQARAKQKTGKFFSRSYQRNGERPCLQAFRVPALAGQYHPP